jgi:hypothetical protein
LALVLAFSLVQSLSMAQAKGDSLPDYTGFLSIGARGCFSMFTTNKQTFVGTGAGGQFAIRIAPRFNSHYFADWIVSNLRNLAQRVDFHSGFSMMPEVYAPRVGKTHIILFPLAGICIDYTRLSITTGENVSGGPTSLDRYSFAVQAGCGVTIPVSRKLDFSLEAHYMVHIGNDVNVDINGNQVTLSKETGLNIDGHFLMAISMDFKLFHLWRKK